MATVARTIQARLDADEQRRLGKYMATHGLHTSAAVRLILRTYLRDGNEEPLSAAMQAAIAEGMRIGIAKAKASLHKTLRES